MKRKFKTGMIVLLTVLVLAAGAFFPKLVAGFMDGRTIGKSSIDPMVSVELNIYKEIPSVGKLVMMGRYDSLLPILERKAKKTNEEVMDAVYEGLTPYMDTGLVAYQEKQVEMKPYLIQVTDMPELQKVVWQVTIAGTDTDYTYLDLIVDDDTGQILRISYTKESVMESYLEAESFAIFADIYFSGFGIADYVEFEVPDLNGAYVGEKANAIRYRFGDEVYGEVNVDLYIHAHGFYVEFPRVMEQTASAFDQ